MGYYLGLGLENNPFVNIVETDPEILKEPIAYIAHAQLFFVFNRWYGEFLIFEGQHIVQFKKIDRCGVRLLFSLGTV